MKKFKIIALFVITVLTFNITIFAISNESNYGNDFEHHICDDCNHGSVNIGNSFQDFQGFDFDNSIEIQIEGIIGTYYFSNDYIAAVGEEKNKRDSI